MPREVVYEPAGKLSGFSLLISPKLNKKLKKAAKEENLDPETFGAELLLTWHSRRLLSFSTGIAMPDGRKEPKSSTSRGFLFQTKTKKRKDKK